MSTAIDKLNAIEVWIDTGWVDSQAKPIQPIVIPQEILDVLKPNPKGWDEVDGVKLPSITWADETKLDTRVTKTKLTRKLRK